MIDTELLVPDLAGTQLDDNADPRDAEVQHLATPEEVDPS